MCPLLRGPWRWWSIYTIKPRATKQLSTRRFCRTSLRYPDTAHLTSWYVFCSSILLSLLSASIQTWQCFQLPIHLSSSTLFRYFNSLSRFWLLLHLQVTSDPKETVKLKRTVYVLCKSVQVIVQTNHLYTLNVSSMERTDKLNIGSI